VSIEADAAAIHALAIKTEGQFELDILQVLTDAEVLKTSAA
jgi:hypothetical protein